MKKVDLLIASQTKEFVKLCRRYCEYLERLPDKNISDFWVVQLHFLSEIYSGALNLPQIDAHYSQEVEKFVTEQEYNDTFVNLVAFIGVMDRFSDFSNFGPPGTSKVSEASLSEMLADIYQELKDFVSLYETDTLENMNDAIAECVDTFGRYWGVKMLSATRIIHVNLYQHRYAEAKKASQSYEEDEPEDDEENFEEFEYEDGMED